MSNKNTSASLVVMVITLVVTLLASCTLTGHTDVYRVPSQLEGSLSIYQQDIYFLQHELPARHQRIYHTTTREEYLSAVTELFTNAPSMDECAIEVGIRRVVALVGDAHTSYSTPMRRAVALNIVWLDEGEDRIYVTAALDGDLVRSDGEPALCELTAIEGIPIFGEGDTLLSRIIPTVSHEEGNLYQVKNQLSYLLLDPRYLYGLGILDSAEGPVEMTFSIDGGAAFTREVEVIDTSTFRDQPWKLYYTDEDYQSRDRSVLPFYLREAAKTYESSFDSDSGVLHLLYNACREDPDQGFSAFVDEAFEEVSGELKAVLVDLRNNSGGNSLLIRPLYRKLDGLNESVELYTAISPATFSSALMNAIELDGRYERMQLIGRPTGGKPNHYGEVRSLRLPSGNYINYSTGYFTNDPTNDLPYLEPEVLIPLGAGDYFDAVTEPASVGVDPVFTYVVERVSE